MCLLYLAVVDAHDIFQIFTKCQGPVTVLQGRVTLVLETPIGISTKGTPGNRQVRWYQVLITHFKIVNAMFFL